MDLNFKDDDFETSNPSFSLTTIIADEAPVMMKSALCATNDDDFKFDASEILAFKSLIFPIKFTSDDPEINYLPKSGPIKFFESNSKDYFSF